MLENLSTLKPSFASPPPPPFACDDAKQISAPTLLVEGELTHQFRRLVNDELQRCLPSANRVTIRGAAHPLERHQLLKISTRQFWSFWRSTREPVFSALPTV